MSSMTATPSYVASPLDQSSDFEAFIDTEHVLDPNTPTLPSREVMPGSARPALDVSTAAASGLRRSAVPSHLFVGSGSASGLHDGAPGVGPISPNVGGGDMFAFPAAGGAHSSSLHNLSFDFYDAANGTAGGGGGASPSAAHFNAHAHDSSHTMHAALPGSAAAAAKAHAAFSTLPMEIAPSPLSWNVAGGLRGPAEIEPFISAASRHAQAAEAHHQRSLSMRDVEPSANIDDESMAVFPGIKSEFADAASLSNMHQHASMNGENLPSPFTEDRSSPSSSTAATSLAETGGSPRTEKRRRLASPTTSPASTRNSKPAGGRKSTNKRKAAPPTVTPSRDSLNHDEADAQNFDDASSNAGSATTSTTTKRLPPSASQITESGQPFPVIDTSAKHSSLFVHPDTSGLTKREARLVKNRAAAFLSRQRKREQFEELESRCKSICRLVWRMWEVIAGPDMGWDAFGQTVLPMLLDDETPDVRECLELIINGKGATIAPTEDGVVTPSSRASQPPASRAQQQQSQPPQPQQKAAQDGAESSSSGAKQQQQAEKTVNSAGSAEYELVQLRAQLEASQLREQALQQELNSQLAAASQHTAAYTDLGSSGNGSEAEQQLQRPFRSGAPASMPGCDSLTIAPTPEALRRTSSLLNAHRRGQSVGSVGEARLSAMDTDMFIDDAKTPTAEQHPPMLLPAAAAAAPSKTTRHMRSHSLSTALPPGAFSLADLSRQASADDEAGDDGASDESISIYEDVEEERFEDAAQPAKSSAVIARPNMSRSASSGVHVAPRRAAASGMALMVMLFSFAFLGLPSAAPGGITRTSGSHSFPIGQIMAPVANPAASYGLVRPKTEDEEENEAAAPGTATSANANGGGLGSPSSHLSAQDLTPLDVADLLNLEDTHIDDEQRTSDVHGAEQLQHALGPDVDLQWLRSGKAAQPMSVHDLGTHLGRSGLDVERGFMLVGGKSHLQQLAQGQLEAAAAASSGANAAGHEDMDVDVETAPSAHVDVEAPMRLTLYVPAPELASAEQRTAGAAIECAAPATSAGKARRTTLRQSHRRGVESAKQSVAVEQPRSSTAQASASLRAQTKPAADFLELEFSLSGSQRRDEASIAKLLLAGAAVGRSAGALASSGRSA